LPGIVASWLCSTYRKDIGTLYLIFSGVSAIITDAMSVPRQWT
jgi:heme/copper-type cytochrome/quinol oxidase subunit 1